jgi:hypothetical protein
VLEANKSPGNPKAWNRRWPSWIPLAPHRRSALAGQRRRRGATLHALADEFGVSAERIRQIEVAALKKMKGALADYV